MSLKNMLKYSRPYNLESSWVLKGSSYNQLLQLCKYVIISINSVFKYRIVLRKIIIQIYMKRVIDELLRSFTGWNKTTAWAAVPRERSMGGELSEETGHAVDAEGTRDERTGEEGTRSRDRPGHPKSRRWETVGDHSVQEGRWESNQVCSIIILCSTALWLADTENQIRYVHCSIVILCSAAVWLVQPIWLVYIS